MNPEEELEPQQYERMYKEEDVPLEDVRKSALRILVYVGAVLALLLGVAGGVIRFPEQVEVPFVFRSEQSEQVYRFPYPVYIIATQAETGKALKKGDELMRITSPEIATLVADYLEAENGLTAFLGQRLLSVGKEREMLVTEQRQDSERMATVNRDLIALDSMWNSNVSRLSFEAEDAAQKSEAHRKLFDEGHISKFELAEYEARRLRTADALTGARVDYRQSRYRLLSLREQYALDNSSVNDKLGKLVIDTRYDSTGLTDKLTLAKNRITNLFGDFRLSGSDLVLLAESHGTVSYRFDGEKELPAGSILLKILYNDSPLYATAKLPAAGVGKIKRACRATLKVSAFPFYEWGVVEGHVESISITPDEKGMFAMKVAIDNPRNLKGLTQIGMEGKATVLSAERTFYGHLFNRFKKKYFEVTLQD